MIDLAPHNPHTLTIATPVIAAAGSLGDVVSVARWLGLAQPEADHGLGAIICPTVTIAGRRGQPQVVATPAGVLYHHGGASLGVKQVRDRLAPRWASYHVPVLISIAGADAVAVAAELTDVPGIAGFELALPALTASEAAQRVTAVRRATLLPLLVRLPGELPDPVAVAQASIAAGADAIALIGGLPACMPQADGSLVYGRLGGPAIFPIALRLVAAVAAAVAAPVIGMGGVATPEHARAMLNAGARAVALASALMADLRRAKAIAEGL
ncbi:dihydroorotate dehydrogenase [Chloroflexus islandicus]|uniref:Dihydroorotate dehydrogenase n=1 Tax=Chloroflexus islandicus TaxID=1707952 RepID=A0A178MG35_9CHLR|nr:dihydroorotate dehydrogenase [Chloroflexus islandicus]OAN47107.1 dihydroorotate dehydrogenase [Chloroflexus islandicus]